MLFKNRGVALISQLKSFKFVRPQAFASAALLFRTSLRCIICHLTSYAGKGKSVVFSVAVAAKHSLVLLGFHLSLNLI